MKNKNKKKNFRRHLFFGVLLFFAGIVLLSNMKGENDELYSDLLEDELVAYEPVYEYGIAVDSFTVHKGEIMPNQFLADILLKYNLSYPEIQELVQKASTIFDVRKIMSGKNYAVFCSKDSTEKARCFVYEPNAAEYIMFDLRDSIQVSRIEREIEITEREIAGTIESSLYVTLSKLDVNPALAVKLADIFAWTIDFYRIHKGDEFRVIFDEKSIEGKSLGVGEIKAVLFKHRGKDFYAFPFNQKGKIEYFDEEGNGMRKAFLQAPLKFSRISSGFNMKRFHPVTKQMKPHLGTDYAAPTGTPILAVADGVVQEAQFKQYNGNYVKIKHNSVYTTQYLHMSKIGAGIKPGKFVKQGDIIGYVGSTGLATGPHVCFRFWKNGKQVDHRKEDLPHSLPIEKENLNAFKENMRPLKSRLDSISSANKTKENKNKRIA
jgi:murein DD-endopeptidase MepM/ murein hydrolase activator NlpD